MRHSTLAGEATWSTSGRDERLTAVSAMTRHADSLRSPAESSTAREDSDRSVSGAARPSRAECDEARAPSEARTCTTTCDCVSRWSGRCCLRYPIRPVRCRKAGRWPQQLSVEADSGARDRVASERLKCGRDGRGKAYRRVNGAGATPASDSCPASSRRCAPRWHCVRRVAVDEGEERERVGDWVTGTSLPLRRRRPRAWATAPARGSCTGVATSERGGRVRVDESTCVPMPSLLRSPCPCQQLGVDDLSESWLTTRSARLLTHTARTLGTRGHISLDEIGTGSTPARSDTLSASVSSAFSAH